MAKIATARGVMKKLRDTCVFFGAWVRDPLRVGAVAPSSCGLAELITSEITPASVPILEFGPGTGVFTRALLARGIPEDELILVECDPAFAHILQVQFPTARVLSMDAARLGAARILDSEDVGAVVSGLPLVSMTGKKRMAILDGAFRYLRPGTGFYQFTYGPRCPVSRHILDRLGLKAKRLGTVLGNAPPASVYRIRRRQPRFPSKRISGTEIRVTGRWAERDAWP
jgi:phospholipid N-methyltransferase